MLSTFHIAETGLVFVHSPSTVPQRNNDDIITSGSFKESARPLPIHSIHIKVSSPVLTLLYGLATTDFLLQIIEIDCHHYSARALDYINRCNSHLSYCKSLGFLYRKVFPSSAGFLLSGVTMLHPYTHIQGWRFQHISYLVFFTNKLLSVE